MGQIDTTRPVHVIVNPHSGYGGNSRILQELCARLRRSGVDLVEYVTTAPRDATRYARQIAPEAGAVIVWGGDGTTNEVAAGLAGTDVPMLPCPAGTENLLAKELRMPKCARKIAGVFAAAKTIRCDMGKVNGKDFLMVIGVGFDGEVVERVATIRASIRGGHISHMTYFWPIWRTLWEHRFPAMRVSVDGQEVFSGKCMAFVGNIPRYASGLRICCDALYNDGLFDLVIFPCAGPFSMLRHSARTFFRRHRHHPSTRYCQFRHLTIETPRPAPSQVDGDIGPQTPLEIEVADAPVRLIVPPSSDGAAP